MPPRPTGQVVVRDSAKGPVYSLRFRAYGNRHRVRLGTAEEGMTRARAEQELANVMADVRRGLWQPDEPWAPKPVEPEDPTFHAFASAWLAERKHELRPSTYTNYYNELTLHLLPFFTDVKKARLRDITVQMVDEYRNYKLTENERLRLAAATGKPEKVVVETSDGHEYTRDLKPLSATYINHTITRLGTILESAVERDLIPKNPVRVNPRNRKVPSQPYKAAHLDRPDQIAALLDAAGQLDAEPGRNPRRDPYVRRPFIALLVLAGLRIGEAVNLRWRDVDLAGGWLEVEESKTAAGLRSVPVAAALRSELLKRKMNTRFNGPDDFVLASRTGRRMTRENARAYIFYPAKERANEMLLRREMQPLPPRLTPHSLRHTYISLRVALGHDAATISRDAGHSNPIMTLGVYTHVMRDMDDRQRAALRRLMDGGGVDLPAAEPSQQAA